MADNTDISAVIAEVSASEKAIVNELKSFERALKSQEQATKENTKAKTSGGGTGGKSGGGGQPSGGNMMPGALANLPSPPDYSGSGSTGGGMLAGALAAIPGIGQAVGGAVKAGFGMMPNTAATISRETSYFNVGVMQGGGFNTGRKVRTATYNAMQGGMTSVGSDGMVSEYLSSRGMVTDTTRNSTYMQTVRSVSNAAKYLNMSNDRASVAIEGLTSGTTSRSMMQNLGIYTSDLGTGKAKTQGQLFSEIASRLTAGRGKVSADMVNESFRRGNLGASLAGLGLSDDQQQLMRQYLVNQANGQNMDLSNDKGMAALAKQAGINPAAVGMQSNTFDTRAMNDAADAYIKGMQDAVPFLDKLSQASGAAAQAAGEFKSMLDTINASNAGGAALKGIQDVVSGLGSALTGFMTGLLGAGGLGGLKNILSTLFGGGTKGTPGIKLPGIKSPGTVSKIGTAASDVLGKLAIPLALVTGTAASVVAGNEAKSIHQAGGNPWDNWGNNLDVTKNPLNVLNWADAPFTAVGTLQGSNTVRPNASRGVGGKGARGKHTTGKQSLWDEISSWFGGGNSSTINANGITGSGAGKGTVTFIMPVNGKISDGYGPRTPPTPTSSSFHHGIDIVASEGTPIHASADGQVVSAAPNSSFGNLTTISHANGFRTLYAHQSRFGVSAGATVKQGQVIGYVGTTGNSTGPHLHFEVHDASGSPIDPMKVIGGSFNGVATQGSNTNAQHTTSGSIASGVDLSSVIDQRAAMGASGPGSYTGASYASKNGGSGNDTSTRSGGVRASGSMGGSGNSRNTSGNNLLTNNRMSIYLPGAEGYKTGKDYVANDGPVNVHSGEAILTAEQASVWRSALKGGGLGKGGNNVNITVNIQSASETEARRFASLVKEHLENDQMIHSMGSK